MREMKQEKEKRTKINYKNAKNKEIMVMKLQIRLICNKVEKNKQPQKHEK
jgi:hypothetical protein